MCKSWRREARGTFFSERLDDAVPAFGCISARFLCMRESSSRTCLYRYSHGSERPGLSTDRGCQSLSLSHCCSRGWGSGGEGRFSWLGLGEHTIQLRKTPALQLLRTKMGTIRASCHPPRTGPEQSEKKRHDSLWFYLLGATAMVVELGFEFGVMRLVQRGLAAVSSRKASSAGRGRLHANRLLRAQSADSVVYACFLWMREPATRGKLKRRQTPQRADHTSKAVQGSVTARIEQSVQGTGDPLNKPMKAAGRASPSSVVVLERARAPLVGHGFRAVAGGIPPPPKAPSFSPRFPQVCGRRTRSSLIRIWARAAEKNKCLVLSGVNRRMPSYQTIIKSPSAP
ncbi:hypothetical protein J3F83DRAFT_741457 [Trichoderma novae-zelandiae]